MSQIDGGKGGAAALLRDEAWLDLESYFDLWCEIFHDRASKDGLMTMSCPKFVIHMCDNRG